MKIYPAAVTNAVPALDGGRILFATATMVHLYDEATRNYTKLEGIEASSIIDLALSPSGETAGVTALQNDCIMSYLYADGKVSEYGRDKCIVAVSNDAKTVYYLETLDTEITGILHIVKNGKDSIISKNASPYFELNRDLTEITFDVDGKTHISRNGDAAKKLAVNLKIRPPLTVLDTRLRATTVSVRSSVEASIRFAMSLSPLP